MKKDLGIEFDDEAKSGLPEDEVTGFCLWLKDTLSSKISKV